MSIDDSIFLGFLSVLVLCAIVLFWRVQAYLGDPLRHERNERWFQQFEQHMRQRYLNRDLLWRKHILEAQFHDPNSSHR